MELVGLQEFHEEVVGLASHIVKGNWRPRMERGKHIAPGMQGVVQFL